jgi:hypothetical protein
MSENNESQVNVEELLAPSKRQLREQVSEDVKKFLQNGGDFTDCPNLDLRKYKR